MNKLYTPEYNLKVHNINTGNLNYTVLLNFIIN